MNLTDIGMFNDSRLPRIWDHIIIQDVASYTATFKLFVHNEADSAGILLKYTIMLKFTFLRWTHNASSSTF